MMATKREVGANTQSGRAVKEGTSIDLICDHFMSLE